MNVVTLPKLEPSHIASERAEKLFQEHCSDVRRIAKRFSKKPFARHVHELDLMNAGIIGLIEAINRYNPENSARFTPFARIRIRGAMLDEIRREDRYTRTDRRWQKRISAAKETLLKSLGREPIESEVAHFLDLSPDEFHGLQQRLITPERPIEDVMAENDLTGHRVSDVFAFTQEDPLRQLLQIENSRLVLDVLEHLKPSERLTLRLSFYENLPLTRIAELLGVTLSRVSQIRTEALKKMKSALKQYH